MYGKKMQTLATFSDPFTHELYQSTNPDTGSFDMNHAQKMNMNRIQKVELAGRMGKNLLGIKGVNLKPWQKAVVPVNNTKTKGDPNTAGTDAALAALQSSLATENAKKAENT
jgi:RNA polymerase II elongation factor ELL